jgi:hypothetical protein
MRSFLCNKKTLEKNGQATEALTCESISGKLKKKEVPI